MENKIILDNIKTKPNSFMYFVHERNIFDESSLNEFIHALDETGHKLFEIDKQYFYGIIHILAYLHCTRFVCSLIEKYEYGNDSNKIFSNISNRPAYDKLIDLDRQVIKLLQNWSKLNYIHDISINLTTVDNEFDENVFWSIFNTYRAQNDSKEKMFYAILIWLTYTSNLNKFVITHIDSSKSKVTQLFPNIENIEICSYAKRLSTSLKSFIQGFKLDEDDFEDDLVPKDVNPIDLGNFSKIIT